MNDDPYYQAAVKGYDEEARREAPASSVAGPQTEKPAPLPVLVAMNTVTPAPVRWLWRNWLPLGTLTVLDGDPGMGKSTLTLDLAARVSQGWEFPPEGSGHDEPDGVLLLSAEDDPDQTIRPRLDAANADARHVHFFRAVTDGSKERPPVLPWDLDLVEAEAKKLGVLLVVIDPFSAYLGSEFDAHKDQDIRRCLYHLATLARRAGVTILLVRHLNKLSNGPALYRGGGSIAISAAARAAMVVGRDPDDANRYILAMNKSNLGARPRSLAYQIRQAGPDVTCLDWLGECDLGPQDILWHAQGRAPNRPDDPSREAQAFLAQILAKGAVAVGDLLEAAEATGLSHKTVKEAKRKLKVRAFKDGSTWYWEFPSR